MLKRLNVLLLVYALFTVGASFAAESSDQALVRTKSDLYLSVWKKRLEKILALSPDNPLRMDAEEQVFRYSNPNDKLRLFYINYMNQFDPGTPARTNYDKLSPGFPASMREQQNLSYWEEKYWEKNLKEILALSPDNPLRMDAEEQVFRYSNPNDKLRLFYINYMNQFESGTPIRTNYDKLFLGSSMGEQ